MGKSVTLKTKIGHSQLEVQADSFKEICDYSTLIGQMPKVCGKCGSDEVYLYHKAPKGNDYYGLACKKCGAEFNFHQKKEGGFYIRYDDQWEHFKDKQQGEVAQPPKSPEQMTRDAFETEPDF
jgi:DNA-directed RNA polymerase subunit M/transcription elongation factor TFIIS